MHGKITSNLGIEAREEVFFGDIIAILQAIWFGVMLGILSQPKNNIHWVNSGLTNKIRGLHNHQRKGYDMVWPAARVNAMGCNWVLGKRTVETW